MWLQFFLGELAFARIKHLLTGDAGEGKVGRVRLIAHWHLDGVGVDGARSIAVGWQQLAWNNREFSLVSTLWKPRSGLLTAVYLMTLRMK